MCFGLLEEITPDNGKFMHEERNFGISIVALACNKLEPRKKLRFLLVSNNTRKVFKNVYGIPYKSSCPRFIYRRYSIFSSP